ncbi:ribosomal protein L37AE/L43A [Clostridium saccharoperbutylacetonicum]|uniref:Uncharacterized protein n=1 Tax=Clostridium saccharoperbutylacetonicum N1-4(HMT) TaxID=931276 RepID=M1MU77_9CLOT|nr:hypothetical protein [Clostridium saccharoperbutylacetonicum]AGF59648.1 hypothetical protein Cspa_135p00880 [Clostridium saccharoperbutylacetonicum N1-4(HMT)]NRT64602.1 ribosomal protein L37AE/L43A [Clostridium saccharoperbutylacetonicum]NSB28970.1 ribosomal protein L37AE/L43A [Clostridium saccharoperbutylacetonicum]NSB46184.1 ribosomal protein L37AE/L43A [Clostridium saccharoperbutylacetonicum]
MCKICKACGQSNFGVIVKKIEKRAAKIVNGKITEYFKGYAEVEEIREINYCFTCRKNVTEEDLSEVHICKVCKREALEVNKNGICLECSKEAEKLIDISKEELILMILKQNKKVETELSDIGNFNESLEISEEKKLIDSKESSTSQELCKLGVHDELDKVTESHEIVEENQKKAQSKKRKIEEKLVKNSRKSVTIEKENKIAKLNHEQKVEIDVEKNMSSRKKNRIKTNGTNKSISKNEGIGISQEVNDIAVVGTVKDEMDIFNIEKKAYYKEVVNSTLIEIEDIIKSMDNKNIIDDGIGISY